MLLFELLLLLVANVTRNSLNRKRINDLVILLSSFFIYLLKSGGLDLVEKKLYI